MINLFSCSHRATSVDLKVAVAGSDENEKVDLDYNLSPLKFLNTNIEYERSSCFEKFELQPNSYEFSFVFEMCEEDATNKVDDFLLKT